MPLGVLIIGEVKQLICEAEGKPKVRSRVSGQGLGVLARSQWWET